MKNKGFSFVELLVAVAILGIISLPIASSFALSAKIDAKARATYSASNAANDVLLLVTEIGSTSNFDEVTNKYEQDLISFDPQTDANQDENISEYLVSYNGYPIVMTVTKLNGFFRIDITLEYTVAGETMQITRKGVLPHA